MKILLVGSIKKWAIENHYINHLRNLGAEVTVFEAHNLFYDYYYRHIWNKFTFYSGFSTIFKKINDYLLDIERKNKFDVVWVFKGMEIYPETLYKFRASGAKVVNLNPDHPFEHGYRGSGNTNVLKSIEIYDLHLCYNLNVKERIELEYNIPCVWLPFGFEEAEMKFPSKEEEVSRVCFIGNPDGYRADIFKKLAALGFPLSLYGNNWEKWVSPHGLNIQYHPAVYNEDFNRVATKYRLQLNIFRPHNSNSHNMRSLEMPGLGCVMIAPDSREHRLLFRNEEEIFSYDSFEEMLEKIAFVLNMPYDDALLIRQKAYSKSISAGYSYNHRSKEVLQIFEALVDDKK